MFKFIEFILKEKNQLLFVQEIFMRNPAHQINSNYIELSVLFDQFVLSICKCRKKLAHKHCFNNYIDSKQNGNVNIQVACAQCNLKYDFIYPYNGNKKT